MRRYIEAYGSNDGDDRSRATSDRAGAEDFAIEYRGVPLSEAVRSMTAVARAVRH